MKTRTLKSTIPSSISKRKLLLAPVLPLSALPAAAATLSFTPDRDNTVIAGSFADDNFGSANNLSAGGVNGFDQRAILSFDVSALHGLYASIDSITLRFHGRLGDGYDVHNTTAVPIVNELYAISGGNRGWGESTSTWNLRDTGTPWAGSTGLGTVNTDYDGTLLATRTFTGGVTGPIDFTFTGTTATLTALIDGWMVDNVTNSQPNPGLLLLDPSPTLITGTRGRSNFYSKDETESADLRPRLIVEYNVIPEPSSMLLSALAGLMLFRRRRD